jgi:hypothetical protein
MPGLKFRVLLDSEKKEEVFRDILISDTDNFESLYHAILKSFNFKGDQMASFYVSDDNWDKGHEISLMDMSYDDDSIDSPAAVMKNATIKDFLEEPDQKFILVYDFMRMWIFLVELIGFDRNEPETPEMLLSMGNPPTEDSRKVMDEDMFAGDENEQELSEDEEDELGLDEFDDDYSEDDLTDYNEYEY